MQGGEYDKTRWFDLIKHGRVEDVASELERFPKNFLLALTDNSQSRHTCLFHAIQSENAERGNQLVELLLREGADCNYKDMLQQTALFYASRYGRDRQVEMLLNAGSDPNQRDAYGQTALYYASREGHCSTINILISRGSEVNSVDNQGQTAIFYSSREGKFEASRTLAENGANVNYLDKTKNTPLTWARRSNNQQLVEYLISKGAIDRSSKAKKEDGGKKKEEKRKSEKKLKCQLMIVNDKGEERPATQEELAEFENNFPDIAKYWKNPETLKDLETMDPDIVDKLKPWEKPGKKLINVLWRTNHSWIFHEPVDPMKLNLPDYFDVVKNPMDFGTIKKKLNNNVYTSGEEFIKDLELVFYNCRLFNPPESDVIKMCNQVQSVYQTQLQQLGLEKYKQQ
ncbi:unnamed protein product [Blepharisma stoltei]|uniref:Bromo domain-containing protein n=1 Tax=Blepharisma stoltei TaxID=1481888 RepID=A0AAU9IQS3_9CILI|nr:unnamed protein product [Blepharisma stoltei]